MTAAPYRALGFSFDFAADDPALAAFVAELFARCRADGAAAAHRLRAVTAGATGRYRLTLDDDVLLEDAERALVVPTIVWAVNQHAVHSVERAVLVHAGAVARGERAALLVGASGAGKTTLTAHLLTAGFAYLTDEAVPFDAETGRVGTYAKPLKLEPGAFALVPAAAPPPDLVPYELDTWHVPPDRLSRTRPAAGVRAHAVVALAHGAAPTAIGPASRAATLVLLAEQSFNLETLGADGFSALVRLVAQCCCARLEVGDLAPTAALVDALLGAPVPAPAEATVAVTAPPPAPVRGPAPHDGLVVARLDGEAAILDPRAARVHHLDATARAVWDACDGATGADTIARTLGARFGADPAVVRADLARLVTELAAAGLVVTPG